MRTSLTTVHCCDPTGRSGYHISPSFLWSRGYRIAPDPIKACCENKKLCFCLDLKFVCDGEVRTTSTIESLGRVEREGIDLWPMSRCGYRLLAHQLVLTVMVCSRQVLAGAVRVILCSDIAFAFVAVASDKEL